MQINYQIKNPENIVSTKKFLRKRLNEIQYSAVVSGLSGIEFQGRNVLPSLNIFYYAPRFADLICWDGNLVQEIIYNELIEGAILGYENTGVKYRRPDKNIEGNILGKVENIGTCDRMECLTAAGGGWYGASILSDGGLGICPCFRETPDYSCHK